MSHHVSSRQLARLLLEVLEDRTLPSCNAISGFVYVDANNNGLLDAGELPIAGSPLELHNANGVVVGTAVSDANGFYQFDSDSTIPLTDVETHTLQFPSAKTNTLQTQMLPKFDTALGQLNSIDIDITGSLTSVISAENLDNQAVTILGNVSGAMTVSGSRFSSVIMTSTDSESFNAQAWDGALDFGGASGVTFAPKTVTGQQHLELHNFIDILAYSGAGTVTFTVMAQASSSASGGGNLVAQINSQAEATVTVTYHYTPIRCLKPGNYTIVQTSQPAGYLDGQESANGVVLLNSVGSDTIPVTLGATDSQHNDFAEVQPASIRGIVYADDNNDGLVEVGEVGIQNVGITLTGIDDRGQSITRNLLTGSNGRFLFTDLRPGIYKLIEMQPAGYLDGKDTVGNAGGNTAVNDRFRQIPIGPGTDARQYRFGELRPASLSGYVWLDSNNDGLRAATEKGLAGVVVTLSGIDDLGNAVALQTTTAGDGSYRFENLRPGIYRIAETQPTAYRDGKDALGTMGGTMTNDQFSAINLPVGQDGKEYNFGELASVAIADVGNGGKKALIDFLLKK